MSAKTTMSQAARYRLHLLQIYSAFLNAGLVYASSIASLILTYEISHRAGPSALAAYLSSLIIEIGRASWGISEAIGCSQRNAAN